jgi:LPXTG-motif cell wall-anchored protein
MWTHPPLQGLAAVIGVMAMWQGGKRVAMQFGKKIIFPWKRHVRLGALGLILWTLGALGFYVTHSVFGATHITGSHAVMAWPIIGLSLFGLGSGYIMDRRKKKRTWLPVAHGVANVILMGLVIAECVTGFGLLETFF